MKSKPYVVVVPIVLPLVLMGISLIYSYEFFNSLSKRVPEAHTFLLRCWQVGRNSAGEKSNWRFSVAEVNHRGAHHGFNNLEGVLEFLNRQLGIGLLEDENSLD